MPSGAFVARRNGKAFITGNSGFPKHKSKLKPAHEPIAVARKPGPKWLGVEASRVAAGDGVPRFRKRGEPAKSCYGDSLNGSNRTGEIDSTTGRYPPNLCFVHHPDCRSVGTKRVKGSHDTNGTRAGPNTSRTSYALGSAETRGYTAPDGTEEVTAWECHEQCPIRLLDEQAGERGRIGPDHVSKTALGRLNDDGWEPKPTPSLGYGDSGSASRFYPTFAWSAADDLTPFLYCAKASKSERGHFNNHPTVKPLEMTRWLLKLACPAGGTALDPFLGSGTTAVACAELGLNCVGIDDDPDSHAIAGRRVNAARAALPLFA